MKKQKKPDLLVSLSVSLVLSLICILFLSFYFWTPYALAAQTQVNEVTDLFERHIENKDELLKDLRQQNDNAINQIKSGSHHDSIEGISGAEGKARELNSIPEKNLDNAGRQKRASREYRFYDENELEPDYTKPGNIMHKLDAGDITCATEDTMRKIGIDVMERLKVIGFNCKTVKGPVHKEPTYYIEIKREEQKNTQYDQKFCEEPRKSYNCHDSLNLKCTARGISWGPWQEKQIKVPARELFDFGRPIFATHHTGGKCFEYKIIVGYPEFFQSFKQFGPQGWGGSVTNTETLYYLREFLVTKHQSSTIDNIDTTMSAFWEGGIFSIQGWQYQGNIGSKGYGWHTYVINYNYRDGKPICTQWDEARREICVLK